MTGPVEPRSAPSTDPIGGDVGAEVARRRLDHPPGERLGAQQGPDDGDADPTAPTATVGRAVAMGIVGAAIGVGVYLVLAIGFSFTAGLLVVAIFTGRFIGLFVRAAAGSSLSSAGRVLVSVTIFLVATTVAVVVTWLWSHVEGGDLGIAAYLDQVYGTPLIAMEFMLGTLVAWWSAR